MSSSSRLAALLCLALASTCLTTGCKRPVPDDATLTAAVQTRLASDSALSSEPIQSSVQAGVATLSGTVSSEAARSLAANDTAGVHGVRTVINNLSVGAQSASATPPAQEPSTAPAAPPVTVSTPAERVRTKPTPSSALIERQRVARNPTPPAPVIERPAPAPTQTAPAPIQTAPPPPQPTFRDVSIPAGTQIPVRITQTLDSGSTQEGQSFSGTVSSDVLVDGLVAIPQGSAVSGRVDTVQEAAHFKGNSLLTISLTSLSHRGERLPISTGPYSKEGKGRGKNTVEKTGIGAAAGAILGGIFGGGSGAAIGAAAGGGAGAGINGVTRGEQVQIPSESIISFRLTSPVNVRIREGDRNRGNNEDGTGSGRRPLP